MKLVKHFIVSKGRSKDNKSFQEYKEAFRYSEKLFTRSEKLSTRRRLLGSEEKHVGENGRKNPMYGSLMRI